MQHASERPRVLVADGDEDTLTTTARRLDRAGYDVLLARDGEEALRRATAEHPDLCLLDVMTPKLSGYDVTRRLRADARTSDVPVLLMTAARREANGFDPGADGYMPKPFSPRELRARVGALVRTRPAA